jgi:hypothetical protein
MYHSLHCLVRKLPCISKYANTDIKLRRMLFAEPLILTTMSPELSTRTSSAYISVCEQIEHDVKEKAASC